MKRWLRRMVILALLSGVVAGALFEIFTRVGRGWINGEAFYRGRPESFWADEIEQWETKDPEWETRTYVRRGGAPRWLEPLLSSQAWPTLLDGDPTAMRMLQKLGEHPSHNVQDWARIGIERIDNSERGPYKIKHPAVLLTARLFEVDEALYQKVAQHKWHSLIHLEKLEQSFLNGPEPEKAGEPWSEIFSKQKPLLTSADIKFEDGKEGKLLAIDKEVECLPSPAQLRRGERAPQKLRLGLTIHVHVQVSSDRRYVRVKLIEGHSELEGIDKIAVMIDEKGTQVDSEIAFVKQSTFSVTRTIPDGGALLLPLQNRPMATKVQGRWLVISIEPRILIEAEERRLPR